MCRRCGPKRTKDRKKRKEKEKVLIRKEKLEIGLHSVQELVSIKRQHSEAATSQDWEQTLTR